MEKKVDEAEGDAARKGNLHNLESLSIAIVSL
jgi:hypothetical protein